MTNVIDSTISPEILDRISKFIKENKRREKTKVNKTSKIPEPETSKDFRASKIDKDIKLEEIVEKL